MAPTATPTDPDLAREAAIRQLDQQLAGAPRDRSKRIRKMERLKARVEARRFAVEGRIAECAHKVHRYRWVPFVGKHWKAELARAQERLKAVDAEARWVEHRLVRAKNVNAARQEWQREFAGEIWQRKMLLAARNERVEALGKAALAAARQAQAGGLPEPGSPAERAWITRQGRAELTRRLEAAKAEERRRERENVVSR